MSGIYIEGMEMPQDGELLCINIYPDGKVCINLNLKCNRIATAIPVPDHGRLVDADRLGFAMMDAENADQALAMVDDAPTIIPADKEADT